ncbi:hypothetical protein M0804_015147 [Polistes exclamans]|nr:hypothetical protein M0804_015147 [Polistes exclamans]
MDGCPEVVQPTLPDYQYEGDTYEGSTCVTEMWSMEDKIGELDLILGAASHVREQVVWQFRLQVNGRAFLRTCCLVASFMLWSTRPDLKA